MKNSGKSASARPASSGDFDINNEIEWAQMRRAWVKEKIGLAGAHAERILQIDEELPFSRHALLLSIAAFCVFFLLWASFATLDETTRGDGRIIPSSEVQILQSLEGGIIDEFFVREGDSVKAGQSLVQLRDIEASSNLGTNQARYLGLLAAVTRLQAEAEGRESVEFPENVIKGAPESVTEELNAFRANREKIEGQLRILEQQRDQRKQEVSEMTTRSRDLGGVIALAREQRSMVAPLVERGSAPRMELLELDRTIQEKQTELNSVKTSLPRARSAVEEAEARIKDIETTARAQAQSELSSKMIEMNAIRESLSGLRDRKTRNDIKSPVDGTIKDIKVTTVGGVVRPGDPIIEIVPTDDQLLVEARIRPADIAFLYPGQKAVVKITAYDFSIYGGLKGEVVEISPDAITNEKGESFYRVRIRTDENSLRRKNEVLPIIPGMVASVDILTGHKTVMEYLLKPFIKTIDTAMHER
ncbi:MAG: HlyD family type I secretion periplasmic adaptor subunit [Rhodospirillales bacterium]|nr:HlyD family type I secretion periplasmic adaptor subunit [Rhodospirillales bacterium]